MFWHNPCPSFQPIRGRTRITHVRPLASNSRFTGTSRAWRIMSVDYVAVFWGGT